MSQRHKSVNRFNEANLRGILRHVRPVPRTFSTESTSNGCGGYWRATHNVLHQQKNQWTMLPTEWRKPVWYWIPLCATTFLCPKLRRLKCFDQKFIQFREWKLKMSSIAISSWKSPRLFSANIHFDFDFMQYFSSRLKRHGNVLHMRLDSNIEPRLNDDACLWRLRKSQFSWWKYDWMNAVTAHRVFAGRNE